MDATVSNDTARRFETVSFDDEDLILVDIDDRVTGYDNKLNAHMGGGKLHRAFSVFLFDGPDWVLLQRRAPGKPLWPGYWANSCCRHDNVRPLRYAPHAERLAEVLIVFR